LSPGFLKYSDYFVIFSYNFNGIERWLINTLNYWKFCKTLKSFNSPIFQIWVYLMKVISGTSCVPKFYIYVFIMLVIPTFIRVQIKHKYTCGQWSFYFLILSKWLFILWLVPGGRGGKCFTYPPTGYWFMDIRWDDVSGMHINSTFLLQFICPLFNRFFILFFIRFFIWSVIS